MIKLMALLATFVVFLNLSTAQSPGAINYQAVARNASGDILRTSLLNIQVLIYSGSPSGSVVYEETHNVATNEFGLFSLQIGQGSSTVGVMDTIEWGNNDYFLGIRVDDGSGYVDMGTRQFVSVPYAFHANTVEIDEVEDADADPTNEIQSISLSNNILTISGANSLSLPYGTGDITGVLTGNGLIGGDTTGTLIITALTDSSIWNASKLRGFDISIDTPKLGQILRWDGTMWIADEDMMQDTIWRKAGTRAYYDDGNVTILGMVGIGTTSPNADLEITDDILVHGITVGTGSYNSGLNNNTALGELALQNASNDWNTAIGAQTLYGTVTGEGNTAVGASALHLSVSGDNNTGVGRRALASNSSGYSNTAIGSEALRNNTNADQNTAVGYYAMYGNTAGVRNTAVGHNALYQNGGGHYNTAVGDGALQDNINGRSNTGIGRYVLRNNVSGDYRSGLGYHTNSLYGSYDNNTGLGFNADPTASNTVYVGNTSVTSIKGNVGFSTYSDARFKGNIRQNEVQGLDFIMKLNPVTYTYDIDAYAQWKIENYGEDDDGEWPSKYDIETIRFSGFIAQEVEQVAEQIGYNFSGVDKPKNDKDIYGLRYAEFVVPLVKAVQEQQQLIEQLQNENKRIPQLEQRISRLEQLLIQD